MIYRIWPALLTVLSLPVLAGCGSLPYYAQSVNGHLNIVAAAEPIEKIVDDPGRPPELRKQLALASEIREFAIDELSLPDNESYRNFVDTGRQFVTWSVFAAPELSLEIRTWCFPVVGCVPYRGYFSKDVAVKFAEGVHEEGYDVHVGGVPAYSTLGLTSDPLLNTMLLYGEDYLAGVIFHELSHQRVYISGDTQFNEAFAVAVERAGTAAWLTRYGNVDSVRAYDISRRRHEAFLELVAEAREELSAIYASDRSDADKRALKIAAIDRLRARHNRIKQTRWGGYDGYDQWFASPINNAKLATVTVYNDLVPAFERLLVKCGGIAGMERFYSAVERIGGLGLRERREELERVAACR